MQIKKRICVSLNVICKYNKKNGITGRCFVSRYSGNFHLRVRFMNFNKSKEKSYKVYVE